MIDRRLQSLEKLFADRLGNAGLPDRRAQLRDEILRRAEELDKDSARELRSELADLGSYGLWAAVVRGWLAENGWVESDTYRFAAMIARALEIGTDERYVDIARQQVVSFVLERFREGKTRLR